MRTPKPGIGVAVTVVAAAVLQSGCAVVQSRHESTAEARRGMVYMLPKALLPIELVEADGVLMLRVMPAVLVGDPAQRYFVSHRASFLASDDVKIEVDAATGLLSKISATAEDQTLAALGELLKAGTVRKAESGSAGNETVLFSGLLDPDSGYGADQPNGRMVAGIAQALTARVEARAAECRKTPAAACADALRLGEQLLTSSLARQPIVVVRASPLAAFAAGDLRPPAGASVASDAVAPALASAAACDEGVCHRALQPFVVELAIPGIQQQSTVVLLPNGGAPIALPLDRAPFVKTEYTVEFSGGQLQSVHTAKPSSALALVKWPLEIYQSVLESTATLIQLRIGANTKEVELAQSQLDTARELARIREELAKVNAESGTPPVAGTRLGGPRRGDALLALELGSRPVVQLVPSGAPVPPLPVGLPSTSSGAAAGAAPGLQPGRPNP